MTISTGHSTRNWDLTIIVGLIVALSAATDIAGFLRLAPSVGLPPLAAVVCVIPVKLIEWKFLTFATRLWRQGWLGKLQSPVYIVIWGIAVGLSALAAHSATYTLLATADHSATKRVETRANLVTARNRNNERLDAFAKPLPRPVNTVEKDLDWANSVLRPALDCTRPPDEGSRACRRVIELRKELAAATDYERLIRDEQELREKLAGLDIESANDAMPKAYEATLGRLTEMDGKTGISVMVALLLGLASAFAPYGLDLLREQRTSPARSGSPRPTGDQVSGTGPHVESAHVLHFPSGGPGRAGQGRRAPGAKGPDNSESKAGRGLGTRPEAGAHQPGRSQRQHAVGGRGTRASGQGRADHGQAAAAVAQFVGMLAKGKGARASGSTLYHAYTSQRLAHGWPSLQPNVFGIHLKTAVIRVGGFKLKSGCQVYQGVALPASWAAVATAPSARAA
jgi:hypothetical protein